MMRLTTFLVVVIVVLGVVSATPRLLPFDNSTYPLPDGRIVGGHATTIAQRPWQISLQYLQQHFCGGILIAPRWVLTAAHCITEGYSTNLNIRAGSASRSSGGQIIAVSRILLHAGWNPNVNMDHDIAALQLASAVTITSAGVATLPTAGATIASGSSVVASGWGALAENGASTDTLQAVTVPSITRTQCRSAYGTSAVTNNMFCAGVLGTGGRDSCQGDSGGPASINGVVWGIVSWGIGCARPNFPGVYVKISQYRSWITAATGIPS